MRRIVVFLCMAFVCFSAPAQYAPANADWNRPVPPFRIADNLYYVGVKGFASYLIVTPDGDMLLDTGFRETVPPVEASIRKLGFRVEDVHILLLSHAHFDHAGGLAGMKAATHARLLVSPGDAPLLERGGRDDFAFADSARFPPVKVDALLQDGVPVRLGGVEMTPHFTPGHTKGCTTWTMTVRDRGQQRHVVFACSLSTPGYQVVNNPKYPGMLNDYKMSIATMRKLPCDIFLAAHPSQFGMDRKLTELKNHPDGPNPFVDPAGYKTYLDASEAELNEKAAAQNAEQGRKQGLQKQATAGH
jgi:metallo-beta-lactamase class B